MKDFYELNDGHILEEIDRIHVATLYLESALSEHALIDSIDEFKVQVDESIETLSRLYQTIGGFDSMRNLTEKYNLPQGCKICEQE